MIMMVNPEWFYEEFLKGKSVWEIKEQIEGLKKEISYLKMIVENPQEHTEAWVSRPSPETQLKMQRLYLEKAEQALRESDIYS